MSGCSYCEDGEGAELIKYAKAVKPLLTQLLFNHKRRVKGEGLAMGPQNEAYSALSVVNALTMLIERLAKDETEKGGTNG